MGNYNTFGRLVVQWMHCQIKFVLLISSGCGYSDHYFPCFKPTSCEYIHRCSNWISK